ncbi:anaphase-promoting complex subunit 1-like [Anneissia japonica]|uniref:anaphase-promoting complex subunit 1-like n=1 Tax=Anneissia japonica TaxID=1529436 RepID=UPI001425554C|nr:anaphase-promoting complex subunit 1-like [Anneissia japonica]
MIAASDPHDFVPFGRGFCGRHPGGLSDSRPPSPVQDVDIPIAAFRDVQIHDKPKESWYMRNRQTGSQMVSDEELYIHGSTVVWSKGSPGHRVVHKTFTINSPIIHAHWCDFNSKRNSDSVEEVLNTIAITHKGAVNVYTDRGEDFCAALPFQVSQAWKIKNGLLFERSITSGEVFSPKSGSGNLPTMFSLRHPLDEPAPVASRYGVGLTSKVCLMRDHTQCIVFTSDEPSLVMTFDTALGVHSVWMLREAKPEEGRTATGLIDMSNPMYLHRNQSATPHASYGSSALGFLSSGGQSFLSMLSYSPGVSPYRNIASRGASPMVSSRQQSPALSHMAAMSRSQSPAGSGLTTPSPGPHSLARYGLSPHNSTSVFNESSAVVSEPLAPALCLDHCWTEQSQNVRDGVLGKTKKVFLTADLCGQNYLCYLIEMRNQLKCVKYGPSNDRTSYIFGTVTALTARDAVSIESMNMMVLLDTNNSLILYTGLVKIGKVHISGIPPMIASQSSSLPRPSTPLESSGSAEPQHASEARGLADEMVLLSPVPCGLEDSSKLQDSVSSMDFMFAVNRSIIGLRDANDNRFSLEMAGGGLKRTSLPLMYSSPLVMSCLEALKQILPKDVSLQALVNWYSTNNAPSSALKASEWKLFMRCLLSMMGYNITQLTISQQSDLDGTLSPVMTTKKHKVSTENDDWEYLINSDYHKLMISQNSCFCGVTTVEGSTPSNITGDQPSIDTSAPLFMYIPAIAFAFHSVYEELKLERLQSEKLSCLATLLFHLASDLQWDDYIDYYKRDCPNLLHLEKDKRQVHPDHLKLMQWPSYITTEPPSLVEWLVECFHGNPVDPYALINGIGKKLQKIISVYLVFMYEHGRQGNTRANLVRRLSATGHQLRSITLDYEKFCESHASLSPSERVIVYMSQMNFTLQDLQSLPFGVALPLQEAISECKKSPPSDWSEAAYVLIGRQDLSKQAKMEKEIDYRKKGRKPQGGTASSKDDFDGMEQLDEEMLRLRFPDDLRVYEVRRLLQSTKPVHIVLTQKPEVTDHEFQEEQEFKLLSISQRTMALPVGRGMFSLHLARPVVTETLPIPKLNLTGKAPPRNNTINFSHIDVPTNMEAWPSFHNGVAAGLKIAPGASQVDSTWIAYNKPSENGRSNEHAGFLMGLGLNGHLPNLATLKVHDYLIKGHEMTSVGILLGLAAARAGTMDVSVTKMLSIHIPALLPPTSTELDVPHVVQVSAVVGIGLVYQGTAHRRFAEVLLDEIGRPPGPEMENSTDRESYSLAAGLALGLIMLGHGSDDVSLLDLNMTDQLYHYMVGGFKRPLTGLNKEKYKSPSYQIKEGDQVNVSVTSPGATLALGMMFFNTNKSAVAQWLAAPETQFLLDFVRPDFLLIRIVSHGLVMWSNIHPSIEWVESNLPKIVKKYAFNRSILNCLDEDVDIQTMSQAECNILAGACLVLGLRFAGSANQEAFNTLQHFVKVFHSKTSADEIEMAGKSTIENCLNVVLLAWSMVMAGTGDLNVLRFARQLHGRFLDITYGNHMATHMAIGFLFLGGGRYTLQSSGPAIGALLCSIFPRFPVHSNDNRYHLQALRHLYVLAAEPRLILPRDVDSNKVAYVPLELVYKDTDWYKGKSLKMMAPCLIPELKYLEQINVLGPRYWPVTLHVEKNKMILKSMLSCNGCLYVKQRAGHLSYEQDPKGYLSLLARTMTEDCSSYHSIDVEVIKSFTSDPRVLEFVSQFCKHTGKNEEDSEVVAVFSTLLYDCVTREKPDILHSFLDIFEVVNQPLSLANGTYALSQLRLVLAFYQHAYTCLLSGHSKEKPTPLLDPQFCNMVENKVNLVLNTWLKDNPGVLVQYLLQGLWPSTPLYLSHFLVYHGLPQNKNFPKEVLEGTNFMLPKMYMALKDLKLSISTIMLIMQILQPGAR